MPIHVDAYFVFVRDVIAIIKMGAFIHGPFIHGPYSLWVPIIPIFAVCSFPLQLHYGRLVSM